MRKRHFILAGIGLAVTAWVTGYLVFGSSLASYLAKLHAGGERLTFAELAASLSLNPGSTSALTNAAARLGPIPGGGTNIVQIHYTSPGYAVVSWNCPTPPAEMGLTNEDGHLTWGEARDLVEQRANSLAELRNVLKAPAAHANLGAAWHATATPWREVRCCANWLYLEALVDLYDGHSTDALASIRALASLANLHREEYRLASQMVRVAAVRMAVAATWELLNAQGITDRDLAALQSSLGAIDLLDGLERGMTGERSWFLTLASKGRGEFEKTNGFWWLYSHTFADHDILFGVSQAQVMIECARSLRKGEPLPQVRPRIDEVRETVESKFSLRQRYFYLFSLLGLPNFTRAFVLAMQTETERRLALTAVALRRFEVKHGHFPENLSELQPEFLSALPRDGMRDNYLVYHVNQNGTFTLYSVGQDGRDDGGTPGPANRLDRGIWGGRDALWPAPVRIGS
jgi:hypothetical protein